MLTEVQKQYLIDNEIIKLRDSLKSEDFILNKLKDKILFEIYPHHNSIDDPDPEIEVFESKLSTTPLKKLIEIHRSIINSNTPKEEIHSEEPLNISPKIKKQTKGVLLKNNPEIKEKKKSISSYLSTYFKKLAYYNDSFFPDLDERIFFEFLLYRSDYNIREFKLVKFPLPYSNVKNNICIRIDRQNKLLKKFEGLNLITITYDGHHGSKQVEVNYDVLIKEFDNIFSANQEGSEKMRDSVKKKEHLKEFKNHFRYLLNLTNTILRDSV